MCAAKHGHPEIVRVLVEWGANKNLIDEASEYGLHMLLDARPRVLFN